MCLSGTDKLYNFKSKTRHAWYFAQLTHNAHFYHAQIP